MAAPEVAYLGPEGTYSHIVALKRFGAAARLVPLPTINDVCAFVARAPSRRGVVPIENSSGGAIHETVDILLAGSPRVNIREEVSLEVRLALLGRRGRPIHTLYSHFAPLEHCAGWIRARLPRVKRQAVASTAAAAQRAAAEEDTAALGSRRLASVYGLQVLEYPVQADVPNQTVFLVIGGRGHGHARRMLTTLDVKLPNQPGALCSFLETFRDEHVNLSRLISRPLRGCPREYAFLVDMNGSTSDPAVRRALAAARRRAVEVRVVGCYAVGKTYKS